MADAIDLAHDLDHALQRGQMVLRYQPIVTTDRSVAGLEALLRWRHPDAGFLEPARFIPLAEGNGRILDLGSWVIHQATQDAERWRETLRRPDLVVCVNVSPIQLGHAGLVETTAAALAASRSDPATLNLEITESTWVRQREVGAEILRALRTLGVRISIDDFGTGYSSLIQLRSLPADFLKVDRSFIRGVGARAEDTAIVSGVIGLARAWGMKVVAEGVETERQVRALTDLGCDLLQGNRLSPALPPEAVPGALRRLSG
jgi:EAL domain-containing protein (putative c-di-GMP-specific phosphodiesterase class I)